MFVFMDILKAIYLMALNFLIFYYAAFSLLLRINPSINQRNNPPISVAIAIHPSIGSSKLRNPSPSAKEKKQSTNHINVAAPKIIGRTSRCKFFLFLKKNQITAETIVHPNAVRKYILFLLCLRFRFMLTIFEEVISKHSNSPSEN